SAALQVGSTEERLRVQGFADALTWISGGCAALASGFFMSAWSFRGLSLAGAGVALLPLLALGYSARRGLRSAARSGALRDGPETTSM
ncbi:MAG: hypothetical protein AAF657_13895, partial [Acidobacteriota bacterium]